MAAQGAVGAAIGQAIGNIGGTLFSAAQSAKQAKKQRRFIKKMAKNKYKYEMGSMRRAGLNPILAGQVGGGTAPSGGIAAVPDYGGLAPDLNSAVTTALEQKGTKEKTQLAKEQQFQSKQDAAIRGNQANLLGAQAASAREQRRGYTLDNIMKTNQVPASDWQREMDESWYGKVFMGLDRAANSIGTAAGVMSKRGATRQGATKIRESKRSNKANEKQRRQNEQNKRERFLIEQDRRDRRAAGKN